MNLELDNFKTLIHPTECSFIYLEKALNLEDASLDVDKGVCQLKWELNCDARTSGVRSLSPIVKSVMLNVEWDAEWEYLTEEDKKTLVAFGGIYKDGYTHVEGSFEIDSDKEWNGKKWTIKTEFKFTESGACYPEDCEVDFNAMTITIN